MSDKRRSLCCPSWRRYPYDVRRQSCRQERHPWRCRERRSCLDIDRPWCHENDRPCSEIERSCDTESESQCSKEYPAICDKIDEERKQRFNPYSDRRFLRATETSVNTLCKSRTSTADLIKKYKPWCGLFDCLWDVAEPDDAEVGRTGFFTSGSVGVEETTGRLTLPGGKKYELSYAAKVERKSGAGLDYRDFELTTSGWPGDAAKPDKKPSSWHSLPDLYSSQYICLQMSTDFIQEGEKSIFFPSEGPGRVDATVDGPGLSGSDIYLQDTYECVLNSGSCFSIVEVSTPAQEVLLVLNQSARKALYGVQYQLNRPEIEPRYCKKDTPPGDWAPIAKGGLNLPNQDGEIRIPVTGVYKLSVRALVTRLNSDDLGITNNWGYWTYRMILKTSPNRIDGDLWETMDWKAMHVSLPGEYTYQTFVLCAEMVLKLELGDVLTCLIQCDGWPDPVTDPVHGWGPVEDAPAQWDPFYAALNPSDELPGNPGHGFLLRLL